MADTQERLEPAIPAHLRVQRTCPLGAPADFEPKMPTYSARYDPTVTHLPIVYVGVQFRPGTKAGHAIDTIKSGITSPFGPDFHDQARFTDGAGYMNIVFVLYWREKKRYDSWKKSLAHDWWHANLPLDGDVGVFLEAYVPSVVDTETISSDLEPEGSAKLCDNISGAIDSHGYWGSARDRIPRAQTDALLPEGVPHLTSKPYPDDTRGHRLVVEPHGNLCLLRSGQDWRGTQDDERTFYLDKVKPVLEEGMREIASELGLSRGCYFNRYMTIQGDNGPDEQTYSSSAWHSLGQLETWVKAKTHLKIFGAGIKHFQNAGEGAKLRLYHEMMVVKASGQSYTYFNCHPQTGMLRALRSGVTPADQWRSGLVKAIIVCSSLVLLLSVYLAGGLSTRQ